MRRHVVLVGLPGSGKSTVGRLAAGLLGAAFRDADEEIVARAGTSVERIFAERGEAAFRALERETMDALLAAEPAVLAPGGGWAAQPGSLDAARGRALLIYLATDPATCAARATAGGAVRPLLAGPDVETRMRNLLAEREGSYRRAECRVATDGLARERVAAMVAAAARNFGGWT
jgi:shikimate kinase